MVDVSICMTLLSTIIIKVHAWYTRHPTPKLLLVKIFLVQICVSVLYNLTIIFRRHYVRTYDLTSWFDNRKVACDGNFIGYGNEFVWLKFARYNDQKGAFQINCESGIPKYWFYRHKQGTPYTTWMSKMESGFFVIGQNTHTRVTFVVRRNEAHNIYHTMCEFYNIFLLTLHFKFKPKDVDILFMDSRPPSPLDSTWSILFGNILHHDVISRYTVFENLIWIPIGYESPMNFNLLPELPYAEEFHNFLISSFGVNGTRSKVCSHLNFTLILRHDYITHPERINMSQGRIQRKIANEEDVLKCIQTVIGPEHHVKGVLLEQMSMKEQIELFTSTDVLIGMHGAGMSHIMSLPSHASVIELFPHSYRWSPIYYFHAFTLWRHLRYLSWTNDIVENEVDDYNTIVSLPVLSYLVRNTRDAMCPSENRIDASQN